MINHRKIIKIFYFFRTEFEYTSNGLYLNRVYRNIRKLNVTYSDLDIPYLAYISKISPFFYISSNISSMAYIKKAYIKQDDNFFFIF